MLDLEIYCPSCRSAQTGGQFLRAYVQRYNSPPVNNLLTFGSQHMGISDVPLCGRWDMFCQIARRAARGSTVYGDWAQTNIIQVRGLPTLPCRDHWILNTVACPGRLNTSATHNDTKPISKRAVSLPRLITSGRGSVTRRTLTTCPR